MEFLTNAIQRALAWARHLGVLPSVVDVTAEEGVTAKPLERVLEVLNAAVPKVPYERLTKAQRTIAEASVYVVYHRIHQAISFLHELEGDASVDPKWLEDVIWCLETAMQMPGTDPESFTVRRNRQKKQREFELERLARMVGNQTER